MVIHSSIILSLLIAINAVESSNGKTSRNQLQIRDVCIRDVNRIYGTKYTHKDIYNIKKSREIAILYLSYWGAKSGKPSDYETLSRIWNGGPNGYKKTSTIKYWKRIKKEIK